jgi:hypothetical protein
MAVQSFVGPWPLLQIRNIFFTQTVGLLGRVIGPSQGRYLRTGQRIHKIKAHTDIYALSGIRTQDPSVRASEDNSCGRAATVFGPVHTLEPQIYMISFNIIRATKTMDETFSTHGTGDEFIQNLNHIRKGIGQSFLRHISA